MKTHLSLIILLFFSTLMYGQNNYKEAYIITLENDTVYGYANFRSDILNLSECMFKKQIDETSITYYPSDIAGYGFKAEDKLYVRDTIEIENTKQLVFLEYMVRGVSASLFYYEYSFFNNDIKVQKQVFVIKDIYGDLHLVEQKEDKKISEFEIIKDVTFRKEIYKILGYNTSMLSTLNDTKLNRSSMSKAIKKYNDITCGTGSESCVVYQSKNKTYLKFSYAFYAGVRYTKLNTKYTNIKSLKSPIGYNFGGQLLLSSPRISNSFSFITDISISQLKQETQINVTSPFENANNIRYKQSAIAFDVAIGVKYVYPKGRIRPGGSISIGRMYLSDQKTSVINNKIQPKLINRKWLKNAYLESIYSLSLDYMLKNNHVAFIQFNYASDEYGTKDTYNAIIGYKF